MERKCISGTADLGFSSQIYLGLASGIRVEAANSPLLRKNRADPPVTTWSIQSTHVNSPRRL